MAVVTPAQRMRSAWFRPLYRPPAPLQTRLGWVKSPYLASTVFNAYWFPAVTPATKPQKNRSTWLTGPSSYSPLEQRVGFAGGLVTYQANSATWNEWWWNETYIPVFRYGLSFSPLVYSYVVETAFLIYPFAYYIFGAPVNYNYDVGYSFADNTLPIANLTYAYSEQAITLTAGHTFGNLQGLILTASTRAVQGPKRVSSIVAPAFDFSSQTAPNDVLTSPAITVSVWSGVDPNPQNLYSGTVNITNFVVNPVLTGGIAGVIYQIKVTVAATLSGTLTIDSFLAVLPDSL